MIADARNFDDYDPQFDVAYRHEEPPTRLRIALAAKLAGSGKQKLANQSRYVRSKGAGSFNGAHRRRDKRSYA